MATFRSASAPAAGFLLERAAAATNGPVPLSAVPEDRERAVGDFTAAIAGSGEYRSEYRLRPTDGEARWIAVQGLVSRDAAGRAVAVVGVVRPAAVAVAG